MCRKCIASIILIVLCNFYNLNAQIIYGVSFGYSLNYIRTNIDFGPNTELEPEGGFNFGLIVKKKLCKKLLIEVSGEGIKKNYIIKRSGNYEGVYYSHHNSYFNLPISLNYLVNPNKSVLFFIGVGINPGYWFKGTIKGRVPNILNISDTIINGQIIESLKLEPFNERYQFDTQKDKRFEFGFLANMGCSIILNKKLSTFYNMRLMYSITSITKKYMAIQSIQNNYTILANSGLLYNF